MHKNMKNTEYKYKLKYNIGLIIEWIVCNPVSTGLIFVILMTCE